MPTTQQKEALENTVRKLYKVEPKEYYVNYGIQKGTETAEVIWYGGGVPSEFEWEKNNYDPDPSYVWALVRDYRD
ncbi:hypothetical protein P256_00053 [Acinetobacter nectaris CIP 110549]|uniref:Uncharacterized protein n=1 Tax=Acinetobacter nectaris CIP 110549 TaxID=1392540 RepID=V2TG95_9GAMM|nr:hypothetical protein [Acinetobacter nectaris]ESK41068.1 hypothetical protein P256_00053 [Acinetobacter nectaris CIP 110549]